METYLIYILSSIKKRKIWSLFSATLTVNFPFLLTTLIKEQCCISEGQLKPVCTQLRVMHVQTCQVKFKYTMCKDFSRGFFMELGVGNWQVDVHFHAIKIKNLHAINRKKAGKLFCREWLKTQISMAYRWMNFSFIFKSTSAVPLYWQHLSLGTVA